MLKLDFGPAAVETSDAVTNAGAVDAVGAVDASEFVAVAENSFVGYYLGYTVPGHAPVA